MIPDVLFTLSRLNWSSLVDILLVALILYWLMVLVQGTKAVQLMRGLLFVVVVLITLTSILPLTAFKWLINNSLPALLVAIPVIFQPELRRALERLGRTGNIMTRPKQARQLTETLKTVAAAARKISIKNEGALIVLERETGLEDYIETGVRLNALVSEELILTIFHPNTPLHDGAIIIRQSLIVAASTLLPLSRMSPDGQNLGTRHRASLGLTEATDAIVVVVSEETGIISISHNGRMIRNLDEIRLLRILTAFYQSQLADDAPIWSRWAQKLARNKT